MSYLVKLFATFWCLIGIMPDEFLTDEFNDENRPYEFSFNIVDFQHRFEKKDADGLVMGEYGFIAADGVYRETSYATDKDGDFKITGMRYRKISGVRDAKALFKDKPEVARMLTEALLKSCSGCRIPSENDGNNSPKDNGSPGGTMAAGITRATVESFEKINAVGTTAVSRPGSLSGKTDDRIQKDVPNTLTKNGDAASLTDGPGATGIPEEKPEAAKKRNDIGSGSGKPDNVIQKEVPSPQRKDDNGASLTDVSRVTGILGEELEAAKKKDKFAVSERPDNEDRKNVPDPATRDSDGASLTDSTRVKGIMKEMLAAARKEDVLSSGNDRIGKALNDKVLERMANDLYYQFNYATTSHGHHENGYRNGNKDGGYNAREANGIDTRVEYLSNEFGHQPNITFVMSPVSVKNEDEKLKEFSFVWYWQ